LGVWRKGGRACSPVRQIDCDLKRACKERGVLGGRWGRSKKGVVSLIGKMERRTNVAHVMKKGHGGERGQIQGKDVRGRKSWGEEG